MAAALCAIAAAQGQIPNAPAPILIPKENALPDRIADKPSQPPAFKIAVGPLGFSGPGAIYLGQRNSVVSLDFLDENRLLFTFRVPGLVHRDSGEGEERRIRAVVLKLPEGTVEAEALWTVHDRQRYLWALSEGRFLLRDRNNLEMGDATLELKPFLRFPGPLLWLEMDPTQQILVTNSREPAAREQTGERSRQETQNGFGQQSSGESDLEVRILRRDSGQVMLVSRARSTVHLPINSDGYLESLRARGGEWLLNLKYFSGGSAIVGQVESSCPPLFDFLSQREVLATTCASEGAGKLVAMTTDGRRLWDAATSNTTVWPLVVRSPDGLRLAREALAINRPVRARTTLDQDDIVGQLVEVVNAADGSVVLETAANPVLDAGGNVAISPSGQRVAVLTGGAVQVFELPAPKPLPVAALPGPVLTR
jgi:ketosteroid isomerase-like protein